MALSLKAMEYFVTALRHGNIAKAASEMNIAASAVANAIDQIETEFDLTLVTRQRARGISANASGQEVMRKCERLLEEYRALLADGVDLKQSLSGSLRLGYYAPVAPAFLPDIFAELLPQGNSVTLELEECDNDNAQDGLLNGTYDVILFVAEGARPTITYDRLISAPPYCLLPSAHPLVEKSSVSMAEIVREPLIVLNRPFTTSYYEGLFQLGDQQAPMMTYANSTEMVRSLVSAGRGSAILNMLPLTSETYSGKKVVARPITETMPALTLAIGYDKSRPRRIVRDFVEACNCHFNAAGPNQYTIDDG